MKNQKLLQDQIYIDIKSLASKQDSQIGELMPKLIDIQKANTQQIKVVTIAFLALIVPLLALVSCLMLSRLMGV